MATLYVVKGPAAGAKFALEGHQLVMIGRDAGCTIQIVDPQLSRNHLQIKYIKEENRHEAIDFNSKNGVIVNEKKIGDATPLSNGDMITIGDTTLAYSTSNVPLAQHVLDAFKRYGQGHVPTQTGD